MALFHELFYAGPKPPKGRASHVLKILLTFAGDDGVTISQKALGALAGVHRTTAARCTAQLEELGCCARKAQVTADGNRDSYHYTFPILGPGDSNFQMKCRALQRSLAPHGTAFVAKPALLAHTASQENRQQVPFSHKPHKQKIPRPLPADFPDDQAKAVAAQIFQQAGLNVDIEKVAADFRSYQEPWDTFVDWDGRWLGFVHRRVPMEVQRAQKLARRAKSKRRPVRRTQKGSAT